MDALTLDIEKHLDYLICKKAQIAPILAKKWAWRIQNDYPEDLKELVYAWIKDKELPAIEINDVSLNRILDIINISFLDAVDLLYILYKDPASGFEIFSRSLRR